MLIDLSIQLSYISKSFVKRVLGFGRYFLQRMRAIIGTISIMDDFKRVLAALLYVPICNTTCVTSFGFSTLNIDFPTYLSPPQIVNVRYT